MPKQVSRPLWETEDGHIFDSELKAIEHEEVERLARVLCPIFDALELASTLVEKVAKEIWRRGYAIQTYQDPNADDE